MLIFKTLLPRMLLTFALAVLLTITLSTCTTSASSASDIDTDAEASRYYAYIYRPDGTLFVEGAVEYYSLQTDYARLFIDGKIYYTSYNNIIMVIK